jgi:hypothetical protein
MKTHSKHRFLSAATLAAAAFLSAAAMPPPAVAAVTAIISNGETKTPSDLATEGWNSKLSSLEFRGTLPSSGDLSSISAILSFPADWTFFGNAGVDQRLAIGELSAGAINIATGKKLTFYNANNTYGNSASQGRGSVLYVSTSTENLLKSAFRFGGEGTLEIKENSSYSSNYNNTDIGGAVFNNGGKIEFAATTTFSKNSATSTGATYTSSNAFPLPRAGGAIFNNRGSIYLTGEITFSENTAGVHPHKENGQSNSQAGGAIFNNTTASLSSNNSQRVVFSSNKATAYYNDWYEYLTSHANLYSGGAIFNAGTIDLKNALFEKNEAHSEDYSYYDDGIFFDAHSNSPTYAGGAIYNTSTGLIYLTGVTFNQNTGKAASKDGQPSCAAGAIYNGGGTVVITDSVFDNNFATAGATAGAIYNGGGTLVITDSKFTYNMLGSTNGKAIYNSGSVSINVSTGKTVEFYENTISIYSIGNANLSIVNKGTLDMRDPMGGYAYATVSGATMTIAHTGNGTWKLAGNNEFTSASQGKTSFYIGTGGTLHLYREDEVKNPSEGTKIAAAKISLAGTDSYFYLYADTKLIVGGGNSISVPNGTIYLYGKTVFDMTNAKTTTPRLSLNSKSYGGNKFGSGEIYLTNAFGLATGTYTLVETNLATIVETSGSIYLDDELYTIPIRTATGEIRSFELRSDTTNKKLQLVANTAFFTGSVSLTWQGTASTVWKSGGEDLNWKGDRTNVKTPTFLNGDDVRFDDTSVRKNVSIASEGVSPGHVAVDTASVYTFTGGPITTSTFTKSGSGTLALDCGNITGDFELRNGKLRIGSLHGGMAPVAKTVKIDGRVTLYSGTTLAFDLLSGNRSDKISVETLALASSGGNFSLNFDFNSAISGVYTLLESESTLPSVSSFGIYTQVNGVALSSDYTANYSLDPGGRNLILTLAARGYDPLLPIPNSNPPLHAFAAMIALPIDTVDDAIFALRGRLDSWRADRTRAHTPASSTQQETTPESVSEKQKTSDSNENTPDLTPYFFLFGTTKKNTSATRSPKFDSNFYGGTIGIDKVFGGRFLTGANLSGSAGKATLHDNAGNVQHEHFRFTTYASTLFENNLFVDGALSAGFSSYESTRVFSGASHKGDTNGFDVSLALYAAAYFPCRKTSI